MKKLTRSRRESPSGSTKLKRLSENEEGVLPPPPRVTWRQAFSYPPLVLGILIVSGLILVIWFAPSWSSYDPYLITQSTVPHYDSTLKQMISPPFRPSADFPVGTDQWGNDLLSLVMYGARVTLIAGLYITLGRILIGTALGLFSGWNEKSLFDRIINGTGTVLGSIPVLISSIILIYAFDIYKGLWVFIVALSAVGWFESAQLVRGEVLRIKHTNYVEAAEAIGLNHYQIIVRHVLPNVLAYLIVITVLEMGAVLLLLAELAFLGVFIGGGTRYNDDPFSARIVLLREVPEWGAMVAQGVRYIRPHPYMVLVPGFAFFISIAGVNALGEGLRWLFTRWPFSTGLLLKKSTLLILLTIVTLSAIILNQTSPTASFAMVSRNITIENVQERVDLLMRMQAENPENAGKIVADYVAAEMNDQNIKFGWIDGLHPSYHYEYGAFVHSLLSKPKLGLVSQTGQLLQSFENQTDFVLAPDQPMETKSITAPIILVNPTADEASIPLEGRIVMTLESLAPVNYSQFAASNGAVGLLLIDDSSILPCAMPQASMPVNVKYFETKILGGFLPKKVAVESDPMPLPTLIISPQVADQILNADEWSLDVFSNLDWASIDLNTQAHIDLAFDAGYQINVDNTIGFLGGYDIDKAHELFILYAPYDTSTGSPNDMVNLALMLEIMQAWSDSHLDPRRSVMFVGWDRSKLGSPGAQAFLDERDTYRLLAPPVPAADVVPMMVWNLSINNALDRELVVSPGSDIELQNMIKQSARKFGLGVVNSDNAECQPNPVAHLPSLSIMSNESSVPSGNLIESFGRSISLSTLKILRLPKYK